MHAFLRAVLGYFMKHLRKIKKNLFFSSSASDFSAVHSVFPLLQAIIFVVRFAFSYLYDYTTVVLSLLHISMFNRPWQKKFAMALGIALLTILAVGAVTSKHSLIFPGTQSGSTASKSGATLAKVYHINYTVSVDGKVIDTTEKEVAKTAGIYDESKGDKFYAPSEVVVGIGKLPKEIESALTSMTPGETKHVTLSAKEAFGDKEMSFETTLSEMAYVKATTTKKMLLMIGNKESDIVPGKTVLTGTGSPSGEVVSVIGDSGTGDNVIIRIPNDNNPFKGKTPKVGEKYTFKSGNTLVVQSYDQKTGKLGLVMINGSPYAGKDADFSVSLVSIDEPIKEGSYSEQTK